MHFTGCMKRATNPNCLVHLPSPSPTPVYAYSTLVSSSPQLRPHPNPSLTSPPAYFPLFLPPLLPSFYPQITFLPSPNQSSPCGELT